MKAESLELGAQMRNVDFVETGLIAHTDSVVVRYSVTNSGFTAEESVSFLQ
jgi:hypothetical protein